MSSVIPHVELYKAQALVAVIRPRTYNPESVGSQAPGPDVCTRRRQSDIPCRGGQYVLTVASRHYVACEHWELERVVTLRLAYCMYAQA